MRITREVPVVLFLAGIGVACSSRDPPRQIFLRPMAQEGVSGVRLAPVIIFRETVPADVPDARTRRNRNP